VELTSLCDASAVFPEPVEDALPGAGLVGEWVLHVHCFLVRTGGRVVLVDTGLGPPWAPGSRWLAGDAPAEPSGLLAELDRVGVPPVDITDVVLTHLHLDHVGWNVRGEAGAPVPTFPNARHHVQAVEVANLRDGSPAHQRMYATHVRPLADAGLLVTVDGPAAVAPGARLWPAPGHSPGHQVLVLEDGDRRLTVSGDTFVHPAQATDPAVPYKYESDPDTAAATRRELLSAGGLLAPAHWPATLVEIAGGDETVRTLRSCPGVPDPY
jgi:glyoxylase-like metal-dependent hydrolase (beta-lactamase superfamily II)